MDGFLRALASGAIATALLLTGVSTAAQHVHPHDDEDTKRAYDDQQNARIAPDDRKRNVPADETWRDYYGNREGETLLVWAGDKAHEAPDFLAVVDFDRRSPRYGQVIRTVPLPAGALGAGVVGNEPHHANLLNDGRTLVLGGLLSALHGQPQVFFYDVSKPRRPSFMGSANPKDAAIADEFAPLRNGGFLATFMGGADGGNPGRVVEFDAQLNIVRSLPVPTDAATHMFNPHGISVNEAANLMVTSDYVCPVTTLHVGGGSPHLNGSVRIWNLATRTPVRTVIVGQGQGVGTMDVRLIPRDAQNRAFTAGMTDDKLYLVDTATGTARAVFDFAPYGVKAVPQPPIWPQLLVMNKAGTRLWVSLNFAGQAGKIVMLDITDPNRPIPVGNNPEASVVDLGLNSGPHFLYLTKDETRLVVTDYFLVQDNDPTGVINSEGDLKVHVIDVQPNGMKRDGRFELDFGRDITTGPARPHAVVVLPGRDG